MPDENAPEPEAPPSVKEDDEKAGKESTRWDGVDEAEWESFPASDPPARWAGADEPMAPDEDDG